MATIQINTGLKVYDISDEFGNIRGQISFNPADVNFYTRALKFEEDIAKWENVIENLSNGESITETDVATKIAELDKLVKESLNELFGDDNASNVVFGKQNVFNTYRGESFIERFLNAFLPIIKEEFMKEQTSAVDRINKYTNQVM